MTMKKSFLNYLLILPAALWLLAACSRAPLPEAEGGRIPVRLGLALPDEGAGVKSLVTYGTETVSSMWLLCFNQVGSCVDCIEATVSGSGITATPGISRDTRSIHFIANKNLTAVKESVIGQQEQVALRLPALVSSKDDPVAFWAWYHGNTAAEVKDFVNNYTPRTVNLLRDRAKVEAAQDMDHWLWVEDVREGAHDGTWHSVWR